MLIEMIQYRKAKEEPNQLMKYERREEKVLK